MLKKSLNSVIFVMSFFLLPLSLWAAQPDPAALLALCEAGLERHETRGAYQEVEKGLAEAKSRTQRNEFFGLKWRSSGKFKLRTKDALELIASEHEVQLLNEDFLVVSREVLGTVAYGKPEGVERFLQEAQNQLGLQPLSLLDVGRKGEFPLRAEIATLAEETSLSQFVKEYFSQNPSKRKIQILNHPGLAAWVVLVPDGYLKQIQTSEPIHYSDGLDRAPRISVTEFLENAETYLVGADNGSIQPIVEGKNNEGETSRFHLFQAGFVRKLQKAQNGLNSEFYENFEKYLSSLNDIKEEAEDQTIRLVFSEKLQIDNLVVNGLYRVKTAQWSGLQADYFFNSESPNRLKEDSPGVLVTYDDNRFTYVMVLDARFVRKYKAAGALEVYRRAMDFNSIDQIDPKVRDFITAYAEGRNDLPTIGKTKISAGNAETFRKVALGGKSYVVRRMGKRDVALLLPATRPEQLEELILKVENYRTRFNYQARSGPESGPESGTESGIEGGTEKEAHSTRYDTALVSEVQSLGEYVSLEFLLEKDSARWNMTEEQEDLGRFFVPVLNQISESDRFAIASGVSVSQDALINIERWLGRPSAETAQEKTTRFLIEIAGLAKAYREAPETDLTIREYPQAGFSVGFEAEDGKVAIELFEGNEVIESLPPVKEVVLAPSMPWASQQKTPKPEKENKEKEKKEKEKKDKQKEDKEEGGNFRVPNKRVSVAVMEDALIAVGYKKIRDGIFRKEGGKEVTKVTGKNGTGRGRDSRTRLLDRMGINRVLNQIERDGVDIESFWNTYLEKHAR